MNAVSNSLTFSTVSSVFTGSLSLDALRARVPAVFAPAAHQSLSPKYTFIPTELSLLPPLVAMFLVLMFKPTGLFGERQVERV